MLTQQAAKDNLEQIINGPIYELNAEFWEEMRTPYLEELRDLAFNCQSVLKTGFHCNEFEVNEFMRTLDKTLHQFTSDYVRRLFRDINTNLLRKFNKIFKKDEAGKNRDWRDIEEGKIRDLWSKCRAQMHEVITHFKYICVPKSGLQDALNENGKIIYIMGLDITPGGDTPNPDLVF